MVDQAEQLLLDLGFHQLRVRIHGKMARIEVMPEEFQKLLENREQIRCKAERIWFYLCDYGSARIPDGKYERNTLIFLII